MPVSRKKNTNNHSYIQLIWDNKYLHDYGIIKPILPELSAPVTGLLPPEAMKIN